MRQSLSRIVAAECRVIEIAARKPWTLTAKEAASLAHDLRLKAAALAGAIREKGEVSSFIIEAEKQQKNATSLARFIHKNSKSLSEVEQLPPLAAWPNQRNTRPLLHFAWLLKAFSESLRAIGRFALGGELAKKNVTSSISTAESLAKFVRKNAKLLSELEQLLPFATLQRRRAAGPILLLVNLLEVFSASLRPNDEFAPSGEVITQSVVASIKSLHLGFVGRPMSFRTLAAQHIASAWVYWFREHRNASSVDVSWSAVSEFVAAILNIDQSADLARSLKKVARRAKWVAVPTAGRPGRR